MKPVKQRPKIGSKNICIQIAHAHILTLVFLAYSLLRSRLSGCHKTLTPKSVFAGSVAWHPERLTSFYLPFNQLGQEFEATALRMHNLVFIELDCILPVREHNSFTSLQRILGPYDKTYPHLLVHESPYILSPSLAAESSYLKCPLLSGFLWFR